MNRKTRFVFVIFLLLSILTVKSVNSLGRIFSLNHNNLINEWTLFKNEHKKIYLNKSDESSRYICYN